MGRINSLSYLIFVPSSIGIIGLGRMAQAIILALIERGEIKSDEIIGVVGQKKSVQQVKEKFSHPYRNLETTLSELLCQARKIKTNVSNTVVLCKSQ